MSYDNKILITLGYEYSTIMGAFGCWTKTLVVGGTQLRDRELLYKSEYSENSLGGDSELDMFHFLLFGKLHYNLASYLE